MDEAVSPELAADAGHCRVIAQDNRLAQVDVMAGRIDRAVTDPGDSWWRILGRPAAYEDVSIADLAARAHA